MAKKERIEAVATPWREVVLICGKCSRKLDGGFGRKGKHALRAELKDALRAAGRRRSVRVAETGCLGLCPKRAVSVLRGGRPDRILAIPARMDPAAVLRHVLGESPAAGAPSAGADAAAPAMPAGGSGPATGPG